jgi:hypothetical protein
MRVLVAADGGARETLEPVAAHWGSALADITSDAATTRTHWANAFAAAAPSMLVVGTSDSARGRTVEAAARRAASAARIPIAAIEDFPGNYVDVAGGEAALVLVESVTARDLCREKLGERAPAIAVVPPARYDSYRARLAQSRRDTRSRWAADTRGERRVLWAGQPDTDDCMRTLAALLPALAARKAELQFKAHPRDAGYTSGSYAPEIVNAGVRWTDLTGVGITEALATAPHLVVTQFSSVAIEAGFLGIPSLWLLLPDAGRSRLMEKKGYAIPPLCAAGGAALVTVAESVDQAVSQALEDADFRSRLLRRFDAYFDIGRPSLPATLHALSQVGPQQNNSR